MAVTALTALTAFIAKAWMVLSIASLVSLTSAEDDASITPFDLPPYFSKRKMSLVIETTEIVENSPSGVPYDVVPQTFEAGLDQNDVSKVSCALSLQMPRTIAWSAYYSQPVVNECV